MSNSEIDQILGRVTTGVYILTLGSGEQATGMLTSWVMQAGFEPPMVVTALKQGRAITDRLSAGEAFVLNVVGESQTSLFKHFGRGFGPGEPAFEGLGIHLSDIAIPILDQSVGHLECEPVGHVDSADHRIFLARIVQGAYNNGQKPFVHIRKSGAQY
jgi:flavin reductase (DIM6/NTAB) family NADH-FMN oxidoreductase RutF